MRILLGITIVAVALASFSNAAGAAVETRNQKGQGGVVCRLTDPTLNTSVKVKATGFRNEGTSATFVICGMESANSQDAIGTVKGLSIGLYSLNGASAVVSCTAVNGYANSTPLYATKTVSTNAGGGAAVISYDASDFGGVPGDPLTNNDYWSITCNLPAKTSVGYMVSQFNVNAPAV